MSSISEYFYLILMFSCNFGKHASHKSPKEIFCGIQKSTIAFREINKLETEPSVNNTLLFNYLHP
jgi:hypothetical protein